MTTSEVNKIVDQVSEMDDKSMKKFLEGLSSKIYGKADKTLNEGNASDDLYGLAEYLGICSSFIDNIILMNIY